MARVYGVSRADNAVSVTFSQYFEGGYKIGSIDPAEWTEPTFLELVRKQNQRQSLLMVKSLQLPSMDVTKSLPVVQVVFVVFLLENILLIVKARLPLSQLGTCFERMK